MSHYDDKMTVLQKMQGQIPQASKSNPVPEALARAEAAVVALAEATGRLLDNLGSGGALREGVEATTNGPPDKRPISCPLEERIVFLECRILEIVHTVTSCHKRLCV